MSHVGVTQVVAGDQIPWSAYWGPQVWWRHRQKDLSSTDCRHHFSVLRLNSNRDDRRSIREKNMCGNVWWRVVTCELSWTRQRGHGRQAKPSLVTLLPRKCHSVSTSQGQCTSSNPSSPPSYPRISSGTVHISFPATLLFKRKGNGGEKIKKFLCLNIHWAYYSCCCQRFLFYLIHRCHRSHRYHTW